jgi:hypothetical protein
MTGHLDTIIAVPPQTTLRDDQEIREALGEEMVRAEKSVFSRMTRGANGYAGQHVETLDQFLESSFQNHEKRQRVLAAAKARVEALKAKGGY